MPKFPAQHIGNLNSRIPNRITRIDASNSVLPLLTAGLVGSKGVQSSYNPYIISSLIPYYPPPLPVSLSGSDERLFASPAANMLKQHQQLLIISVPRVLDILGEGMNQAGNPKACKVPNAGKWSSGVRGVALNSFSCSESSRKLATACRIWLDKMLLAVILDMTDVGIVSCYCRVLVRHNPETLSSLHPSRKVRAR